MVSSRFSHRRRTRGTAKICHVAPVPIPVPPPPPWPPTTFFMHVIFDCPLCSPAFHLDYIMQLHRQGSAWQWIGTATHNDDYDTCDWIVYPDYHAANLDIHGQHGLQSYHMEKAGIPVTWDTTTHYFVNTWDTIFPAHATGSAEFDF